MHDTLFEHEYALHDVHLIQYAVSLGLNAGLIRRAIKAHYNHERVREDYISGVSSGVKGTPTFFIDEDRYGGPPDLDSLLAALDNAAKGKHR